MCCRAEGLGMNIGRRWSAALALALVAGSLTISTPAYSAPGRANGVVAAAASDAFRRNEVRVALADGADVSQLTATFDALGVVGMRTLVHDPRASAVADALRDYYVLTLADGIDAASRVTE